MGEGLEVHSQLPSSAGFRHPVLSRRVAQKPLRFGTDARSAFKLEEERRKLAEFILKRLLKEKMATAKEEVDARMKQFEAGKGTLDFLIAASKRLLNAEMEDNPDVGAQTPLQAHFERMKKIQDVEQQRFDNGRISIEDLDLAKYHRLEAGIWLERAKAGKWHVERGNP
jgi:hypothetical protein